jgi:hypothetical protein
LEQSIIRKYEGAGEEAVDEFIADAARMASSGYYPASQVWVPSSNGTAAFMISALLCIVVIGFFMLAYMLIVSPGGTLTVTYLRQPTSVPESVAGEDGTA